MTHHEWTTRSVPAELAERYEREGWWTDETLGGRFADWLAASPDAHRAFGHFWLDRKIRATHVFRHTRDTINDRRELIRALDALAGLPSVG